MVVNAIILNNRKGIIYIYNGDKGNYSKQSFPAYETVLYIMVAL